MSDVRKTRIFVSYAHEDKRFFADLNKHLSPLRRTGKVDIWHDRMIPPGSEWKQTIHRELERSDLILLLVSPDFWNSDFCATKELPFALERHKDRHAKVIPILVRSVDIEGTPLKHLQFLPREGVPVEGSSEQEEWTKISKEIKEEIGRARGQELRRRPKGVDPALRRDEEVVPGRPRILFTSESPRRKRLLEQIDLLEGRDFVTFPASVVLRLEKEDAANLTLQRAKKLALRTAGEKIHHAVKTMGALLKHGLDPAQTVVVGADTVVFCRDHLLDRPLLQALEFAGPRDIETAISKATQMLAEQRGQETHIITALVVAQADHLERQRSACVVTEARMKDFDDRAIEAYVRTREPFDKAGAFGIQGKGVALFEGIRGSYTNVVGLPVLEFWNLLRDPIFKDRVFPPRAKATTLPSEESDKKPGLSLVSVGDINYDLAYHQLEVGFFRKLKPPGGKVSGEIYRAAGGTAVNFAKGAQRAGFTDCAVVGIVGGDVLGSQIESDLRDLGVRSLLRPDPTRKTSVAIVLRDKAARDTSLTLTDTRQQLTTEDVKRATVDIEQADVLYISGYALIDSNRRSAACRMAKIASRANRLVVLDVVVGMDRHLSYDGLKSILHDADNDRTCVDVLVSETPEVLRWLGLKAPPVSDPGYDAFIRESVLAELRATFPTIFLRAPHYSTEYIATPEQIMGPRKLEYPELLEEKRLGYGDFLTAKHVFDFLSPRILLASKSPQRLELLKQLVAPNKIEVRVSGNREVHQRETPEQRVLRLAREKAEQVLAEQEFSPSIAFIVGADTEIVLEDSTGMAIVKQPQSVAEARSTLSLLSGKAHRAITGLAVAGLDPDTGKLTWVQECASTEVKFRQLTEAEINEYALSGEPLGRAGGYAIQGWGTLMVESICGSYSNIVGLPLENLADILDAKFKTPVWELDKVSGWKFSRSIKGAK